MEINTTQDDSSSSDSITSGLDDFDDISGIISIHLILQFSEFRRTRIYKS